MAQTSDGERLELRQATTDDVPRLASVLADAFHADPVFTWMLPRLRQGPRMRLMFAAELESYVLARGTVWTTTGYHGAVAELPPGKWEMHMTLTLGATFTWLRALGTRMLLAGRVAQSMEEHHLREPHFYVRTVAVASALQGRGIGSALMGPTLHRADAAGVATYIEASNERSAALYERLGFVHLGMLELPDGGPPLWPMRRPPAAPRTTVFVR